MTGDKREFMNFKKFDWGVVTLGNSLAAKISSKGTLILDGENKKTLIMSYM